MTSSSSPCHTMHLVIGLEKMEEVSVPVGIREGRLKTYSPEVVYQSIQEVTGIHVHECARMFTRVHTQTCIPV